MPDLSRRERILLQGLAAVAFVALAAVLLPKVRRRFFPKIAARVLPLEGESAVLPRRVHPKAAPGALRVTRETLAAAGETRRWVLVAPAAPAAGKAYPVVLVLHGDGGGADSFHAGFPFEQASGESALLVYPEGRPAGWDLETTRDNADVRFMELLVDALAARFSVDRTRVFAAGYSRGGFFANVLACQRAGFLRALSSSAGGAPYGQASAFVNGFTKCPGQEPTAAIALHGTIDMGVGVDSGRFSAEYWAYVNGCKTDEMEATGYPECTSYRGCPAGKRVAWCEIAGLNHWVWERAAEASWTFFRSQAADADAASP
jgi:polyhydroxybutyrate depolymerase